jgi:hypothetical protein
LVVEELELTVARLAIVARATGAINELGDRTDDGGEPPVAAVPGLVPKRRELRGLV